MVRGRNCWTRKSTKGWWNSRVAGQRRPQAARRVNWHALLPSRKRMLALAALEVLYLLCLFAIRTHRTAQAVHQGVGAPELFRAVIRGVPLLDMLRYHKFGLGKAWVPEYGDPEVEEHFRVLHAYSPYHHVQPDQSYPALLMPSADTDDRVDPMHARKFTAAIQATPNSEAYLRIERNAGHGGADMRRKFVERTADEYAFLLSQLR